MYAEQVKHVRDQLMVGEPHELFTLQHSNLVLHLASNFRSALGRVSENLGYLTERIKTGITGEKINNLIEYPVMTQEVFKNSMRTIRTIPTTTILDVEVRIPEGLKKPVPEYMEYVVGALSNRKNSADSAIAPLEAWALRVSADPETLSMPFIINKVVGKKLEDDIKGMGKFITGKAGDTRSSTTFKKAYRSFSDLEKAKRTLDELVKAVTEVLALDLLSKATTTAKALSIIADTNYKDGTLEVAQKQVIQNVAESAYVAARELEFTSVLLFQAEIIITSFNELIEKLESVAKS